MKFAKNSMNMIEIALGVVILIATALVFLSDHSGRDLHEQLLGNIDRYAVVKIALGLMSITALSQVLFTIFCQSKKFTVEVRLISTLTASFGFNLLAIISLSISNADGMEPSLTWLFYFFMSFIADMAHLNIRGGLVYGPGNH